MNKLIQHKYTAGFTIIELMVTLGIATILSLIAVPSFQSMTDKGAQRSATVELIISISYARTESIRRGEEVHIRNFSGTETWSTGWCITTASDCTSGVIRRYDTSSSISIKANTSNLNTFSFDDQGFLKSSSDSISFCTDTKDNKITITPVGHALLSECTCNNTNICS